LLYDLQRLHVSLHAQHAFKTTAAYAHTEQNQQGAKQ
jgi:hypothetical protein